MSTLPINVFGSPSKEKKKKKKLGLEPKLGHRCYQLGICVDRGLI